IIERTLPINAVHLAMLVRPLVPDPRVDQNSFTACLNEEAIHVHANPILIVRRRDPFPQVPRHHSEHRTTIKPKLAVANYLNSVIAKLHRVLGVGRWVFKYER